MRISRSNRLSYQLLLTLVLFGCYSCTVEDIDGKRYFIASEARKYMIDTTETSFRMEDNVGIKETFYIKKNVFFNAQVPNYLYYEEFKGAGAISGTAVAEKFGFTYESVLNQYYFRYSLTSSIETRLEISWCLDDYDFTFSRWKDNNRFEYNFDTKKVSSKLKPKVKFYDTLEVNNITYQNVIEIDYSSLKDKINENTPIKIYFAGKAGLIKFVPLEGIEVERIK